jgi:hypothetical protein
MFFLDFLRAKEELSSEREIGYFDVVFWRRWGLKTGKIGDFKWR